MLDLINGLKQMGFECYLFFPRKKEYILRSFTGTDDEKVHNGPQIGLDQLQSDEVDRILSGIIAEIKPSIVHFQSIRNLPLSCLELPGRFPGIKSVISVHEYFFWCPNFILMKPDFCNFETDHDRCTQCLTELGYKIPRGYVQKRRKYWKDMLGKLDRVISPSFFVRDLLQELFGMELKDRITVIENGVHKENFLPFSGRTRSETDGLNVAFIGNFLPHKGSDIFKQVIRHDFGGTARINFFVLGNMYESIGRQPDNLTILGGYKRDTLGRMLRENHIDLCLLLSTIPETFSYTLSEVVLCGRPVMALDLGSLRERVSRYKVGPLVPAEAPVEFIRRHIELLDSNRQVLKMFERNCMKAAMSIPGTSDMISSYAKLYREITGRRATDRPVPGTAAGTEAGASPPS